MGVGYHSDARVGKRACMFRESPQPQRSNFAALPVFPVSLSKTHERHYLQLLKKRCEMCVTRTHLGIPVIAMENHGAPHLASLGMHSPPSIGEAMQLRYRSETSPPAVF